MISYLLPTRNRRDELAETLAALGRLDPVALAMSGGAEVVIVDNASDRPVDVAAALENGMPVRLLRLEENRGAAGRNDGAAIAAGDWLVMLDDDSAPVDQGHLEAIGAAAADVGAIAGEITLRDGGREAGGLPEVFVGCGAAVRRRLFLELGGYDPAFGFYAEEYDLSARIIGAGFRVAFDRRLRVEHRKVTLGRDMDVILARLVRNNGWVMQRYAPRDRLESELAEVLDRYRLVAERESAQRGYERGADELRRSIAEQPLRVMDDAGFDRFKGVTATRAQLRRSASMLEGATTAIVHPGKNAEVVRLVAGELGARPAPADDAAVLLIGTLSPGPMLDAADRLAGERRPVLAPWNAAAPQESLA